MDTIGSVSKETYEAVGKEVPVPGIDETVKANPQSWLDVLFTPVSGFYGPAEYTTNAIDVSLFALVIGGFPGAVNRTGAISNSIKHAMVHKYQKVAIETNDRHC